MTLVPQRVSWGAMASILPSFPALTYLALHATEGWQLLVVGALLLGFVVSLMRRSRIDLAVAYVLTLGLFAWVFRLNN